MKALDVRMIRESGGSASEKDSGFAQKIAEKAGSLGVQLADAAGSIDDVAKVVANQAQQFEELRTAADAMVAANERIAGAVENTAKNAGSAAAEMSASRGSLESSLADVRSLAASATAIESKIAGLRQALEQIAKVAQTIDAIAKQTNLLALNATIEAARAGEAGRGFAVVAQEVKALATQTGKATEEIDRQVTAIREASGHMIKSVHEITQTIANINGITTSIAGAVEQQNAATSQISESLERASIGTEHVTAAVSEIPRTAAETGNVAERLDTLARDLATDADGLQRSVDSLLAKLAA
jgi:methyl-accepting chemotaxis protein